MLDIPIQLFHLEDASAPDSNCPLFDVSLTDETPPEDLLKLRLDYALTNAQAAISGSIFWFTYKGCVFFVSYKTNTIQSVMEYTNGKGQLAFVGPVSSKQPTNPQDMAILQEERRKFYQGLYDVMAYSPDDTTRDMLESIIHLVPLG